MTTITTRVQPDEVESINEETISFYRRGRGQMEGEVIRERPDGTLIVAVDESNIPPKDFDEAEPPGCEQSRLRCALRWAIEEANHFKRIGEGVACLHCHQLGKTESDIAHMRGCPYRHAHELAYKE